MTTLVVYPDAHAETTTVDGYVARAGVNQTFADIRSGAGTTADDNNAADQSPKLIASATSNQYAQLNRSIFLFDTSTIGSGDTVSSATISLFGTAKGSGLGSAEIDIVTSAPASNTALANGDYANLGTTPLASKTSAAYSTSAYNDFTLATGDVTKAGVTKLGATLNWDTDNSFGGAWGSGLTAYFGMNMADQTGTTNDPKLTVVYTTPSATRRVMVIS